MNELEELRLRIAKAKGWVFAFVTPSHKGRLYPYTPEDTKQYGLPNKDDIAEGHEADIQWADVPNWPNDIGAVWELEESIPDGEHSTYIAHLWRIVREDCLKIEPPVHFVFAFAHATPAQRCKAWLAWKEEKK